MMILSGTGHRPSSLPGKYSARTTKALYDTALAALKELNPTLVFSGGALGWDTALAIASYDLGVPYVVASPFVGQESKWPTQSQKQYQKLLSYAQEVVVVSKGGYSASKMQRRNEYLVDHCDKVVALYNGSKGGTQNCLLYANKQGKPVINAWNAFLHLYG